ncbi:UNVERIFIED_CONTAM: hypothetical protein NCL1_21129 [Trichonephila clavipes]
MCCDAVNTCVVEENKLDPNIIIKLSCAEKVCAVETSHESKCTKLLHKACGTAAETLLREVHNEVRKAYEAPTDIPSCARYVAIVLWGKKLGESSAEYGIWFEGHRKDCNINHSGSSTSMEMEEALSSRKDPKHWDFSYNQLK